MEADAIFVWALLGVLTGYVQLLASFRWGIRGLAASTLILVVPASFGPLWFWFFLVFLTPPILMGFLVGSGLFLVRWFRQRRSA